MCKDVEKREIVYENDFRKAIVRKTFWSSLLPPWKNGFAIMFFSLLVMSLIFYVENSPALISFLFFMLIGMFGLLISMIAEILYRLKVAKNIKVYSDGIYDLRREEKIVTLRDIESLSCDKPHILIKLKNGEVKKIKDYYILDFEHLESVIKHELR